MSTVASRTFRSNPHRDALETWHAIVELLTKGKASSARTELMAASGICSSVIADQSPKGAAIIVTCDGPRTRVYCTYDEDAIDGSNANEEPLGFDPLAGAWAVSLPCESDDLVWVQNALKNIGSRITARDKDERTSATTVQNSSSEALELDPKGFLGA